MHIYIYIYIYVCIYLHIFIINYEFKLFSLVKKWKTMEMLNINSTIF